MSKKLVLWVCFGMVLGIIAAPAAFAETIIMAVQSCRTDILQPDTNRHDTSKLSIRSDASSAKSWIKFDISELDVDSLKSATLTVSLHEPKTGDRYFDVSYVNDNCLDNIDWDERSLTWNNAPGNKTDDLGGLDPSKTTLVTRVNFTDGEPGDSFTFDVLEVLESDTDGIVQFVFHNSNGLLNLATYDHAEEAWRPFLSVIEGPKSVARKPSPADEAEEVAFDVDLTWTPGAYAPDTSGHNVYFSDNFDDVNNGVALVGPSQDASSYDPGRLEFGVTYYWRVDEANSVSGWDRGDIWQFTTESFSYPISAGNINATASSQVEGQGPENTVNESGLVDGLHSNSTYDMWVTVENETLPAWIQYEFNKTYKLDQMLVWNYNGASLLTGLGLKDITVEYSTDGVDWILNDSVSVCNQAPGANNYAATTTVPFGGVAVKYVKITATANWFDNLMTQYGLSEVRFLYIPTNARNPVPDDGATDVAIDTSLGWRAGREAAEHNVYISIDQQAVIGGTVAPVTVSRAGYGPLALDLGSTYYWRVDEVNNAGTAQVWEGGTWNFTTEESLVVDDFESYNDIPQGEEGSSLIYLTWVDGYDNPAVNGSTMGYISGASLETATVRSGHSAPLMYNNTTAGISEVTANAKDLPGGSDWTVASPEQLVLWVYGSANNPSTEQMYVEIDGVKKIFSGDIALEQWQDFSIDLASLGINLNNVGTVTIGLEKTGATGGSGTVFIDDILLSTPLE
ncbi:MAG: discoidin domain-containing protein [Sedimentisphaerales bacterium]|nr:discoidin domain-containing protein [Sedimentisphaerales bacterium]